ncbi:MAG: hypothetical protein PUD98_06935, partial [Bacteroidales bacterium]|nr:hypothetical protein [Bacteroidales bacterium]
MKIKHFSPQREEMRGDLRRQENKWNASERRDLPTRLGIRGVLKASSHFCAPIHHSCAPIRYLPLDEWYVYRSPSGK